MTTTEQEGDACKVDEYCGFVCSDITDRQKAIIKDITDFSEYNREFALVMFGKCIELLYNSSMKLPKQLKPTIIETQ